MNGAAVSYDKKYFKYTTYMQRKSPKEKQGNKKIIWSNNGNNK